MHAAGKIFVKTYLKATWDFFPIYMWNFPICDIFIQQKGKVFSPHEKNPEGGWSAYWNDFLSQKKNYSM